MSVNNTWNAEVAAPKIKPGGNQSLLGICQGISFWLPTSLLNLSACDLIRLTLRLGLVVCCCDEENRHREELSLLLGPIWLLRPVFVWFMAEARSRAILLLVCWLKPWAA